MKRKIIGYNNYFSPWVLVENYRNENLINLINSAKPHFT